MQNVWIRKGWRSVRRQLSGASIRLVEVSDITYDRKALCQQYSSSPLLHEKAKAVDREKAENIHMSRADAPYLLL